MHKYNMAGRNTKEMGLQNDHFSLETVKVSSHAIWSPPDVALSPSPKTRRSAGAMQTWKNQAKEHFTFI